MPHSEVPAALSYSPLLRRRHAPEPSIGRAGSPLDHDVLRGRSGPPLIGTEAMPRSCHADDILGHPRWSRPERRSLPNGGQA
jgi:hypothetical protein